MKKQEVMKNKILIILIKDLLYYKKTKKDNNF